MRIQSPRGLESREQETGWDHCGAVLNEAPRGFHVAKSSSYVTSRQRVPQLTMPSSCFTFSTQLPCLHSPPTSVVSPLLSPLLDSLLPSLPMLGAPGSHAGPLPPHHRGDQSYPQAFKTISVLIGDSPMSIQHLPPWTPYSHPTF